MRSFHFLGWGRGGGEPILAKAEVQVVNENCSFPVGDGGGGEETVKLWHLLSGHDHCAADIADPAAG